MSRPGKNRQLISNIIVADTRCRLSYFKYERYEKFSFLSSFLSIKKSSYPVSFSQVFAEVSEKKFGRTTRRPVIYFQLQTRFPQIGGGKRTDNKLTRVASSRVLIIQHTPNKWALVPRNTVGSRDTTARFSRASIGSRRHMANPFATA